MALYCTRHYSGPLDTWFDCTDCSRCDKAEAIKHIRKMTCPDFKNTRTCNWCGSHKCWTGDERCGNPYSSDSESTANRSSNPAKNIFDSSCRCGSILRKLKGGAPYRQPFDISHQIHLCQPDEIIPREAYRILSDCLFYSILAFLQIRGETVERAWMLIQTECPKCVPVVVNLFSTDSFICLSAGESEMPSIIQRNHDKVCLLFSVFRWIFSFATSCALATKSSLPLLRPCH